MSSAIGQSNSLCCGRCSREDEGEQLHLLQRKTVVTTNIHTLEAESAGNHKLIRRNNLPLLYHCNQTLTGRYFYPVHGSILGMRISWQIYSRNQYTTLQPSWFWPPLAWWNGANTDLTANYNSATTMYTNTNWTNQSEASEDYRLELDRNPSISDAADGWKTLCLE